MTPPSGYALVTGASRGIGESFARALARRRHNLVLVARSKQRLETLAGELRASDAIRAVPVELDLTAPSAAHRLAGILDERGLQIELLVNNAGVGARGEFGGLALDIHSGMLDLNVRALVELTHCLLPPMLERGRGSIINVSSLAGFQALPYATTYAATKAFVTSFSMGLAEELRPHGVIVVTLCPGRTGAHSSLATKTDEKKVPGGSQSPEEVVERALKQLDRGGGLVVPRLLNKTTLFLQRLVPRSWVARFAATVSRP